MVGNLIKDGKNLESYLILENNGDTNSIEETIQGKNTISGNTVVILYCYLFQPDSDKDAGGEDRSK